MTRQFSDIRTAVNRLITPNHVRNTPDSTSAGQITDAAQALYANGTFINKFIRDDAGTVFRVTDFTASTGVFALAPSGSTPDTGTYEVYQLHPDVVDEAIRRVARRFYPVLSRAFVSEALVTGSPLPDPGFEDWSSSSALNKWDVVTSTLARQTASPLFGSASARLSGSAGYLHPKAQYLHDLLDLRDHTIDIHAIASTGTASNARVNVRVVDTDGNVTNNRTGYHDGSGEPRELKLEGISIPANARSIDVRLEMDAGANVDWEWVYIIGGPRVDRLHLPSVIQESLTNVEIASITENGDDEPRFRERRWTAWPYYVTQKREDQPGNSLYVLEWRKPPPAGYAVRIEGPAVLNNMTADADTILITDVESEYFEALSALDVLDNTNLLLTGYNEAQLERIKNNLRLIVNRLEKDLSGGDAGGVLNWDL